jgi:hypothetical protein
MNSMRDSKERRVRIVRYDAESLVAIKDEEYSYWPSTRAACVI